MLIVTLVVLAAAASAQPARDMPVINPKANQPLSCPATSRYEVSKRGKNPKVQKLNELPDADLYRTVYRRIDGCEIPIVVKYGVSGG